MASNGRSVFIATTLLLAAAAAVAPASAQTYYPAFTFLRPEAPVVSNSSGSIQLVVGPTEATFRLRLYNITGVTMVHIHANPSGTPIVNLVPNVVSTSLVTLADEGLPLITASPNATRVGKFNASYLILAQTLNPDLANYTWTEMISNAANGLLYVNVHTEKYPAGEIRGTLAVQSGTPPNFIAFPPPPAATPTPAPDPAPEPSPEPTPAPAPAPSSAGTIVPGAVLVLSLLASMALL